MSHKLLKGSSILLADDHALVRARIRALVERLPGVKVVAEAKDGLNSIGVGAWFNVLNPGQMLLWHVVLLPFAVGVITVVHIVLVRRQGVVPPIDDEGV